MNGLRGLLGGRIPVESDSGVVLEEFVILIRHTQKFADHQGRDRHLLQPVPVGVGANGSGGLFRPYSGEQPEVHRLDRTSVPELVANVLRLHLRR